MNHTNIITTNIKSKAEFRLVDQMINIETKRRVLLVPEAQSFDILTACYIDGEFTIVSHYDLEQELIDKLASV
ncbi:hypothetical protein [Tenacibaculum agarivorans]|uniref:hypothetical protein n=1 Tax=Tenacibaculum agarivorans TaxID=1908389 RepID=UPI000B338355|nr:hypothetical protein [Tenacibaculum agarivorans]